VRGWHATPAQTLSGCCVQVHTHGLRLSLRDVLLLPAFVAAAAACCRCRLLLCLSSGVDGGNVQPQHRGARDSVVSRWGLPVCFECVCVCVCVCVFEEGEQQQHVCACVSMPGA
jgi:hypothetical protein